MHATYKSPQQGNNILTSNGPRIAGGISDRISLSVHPFQLLRPPLRPIQFNNKMNFHRVSLCRADNKVFLRSQQLFFLPSPGKWLGDAQQDINITTYTIAGGNHKCALAAAYLVWKQTSSSFYLWSIFENDYKRAIEKKVLNQNAPKWIFWGYFSFSFENCAVVVSFFFPRSWRCGLLLLTSYNQKMPTHAEIFLFSFGPFSLINSTAAAAFCPRVVMYKSFISFYLMY